MPSHQGPAFLAPDRAIIEAKRGFLAPTRPAWRSPTVVADRGHGWDEAGRLVNP